MALWTLAVRHLNILCSSINDHYNIAYHLCIVNNTSTTVVEAN